MNEFSTFISGYDNENLQKSKEKGLLGWKKKSIRLKIGDYVFIYNTNSRKIESLFEIKSVSENNDPFWYDEIKEGLVIYKNRWNAKLIKDNIDIGLDEINKIIPFSEDPRNFTFKTIRNPYPTFLNEMYPDFQKFLLQKVGLNNLIENDNQNTLNTDMSYFLVQVGDYGSKTLLEKGFYQHINWYNTARDSDHGKVLKGDILLVYFASNSVKYKMTLKKVYKVNEISKDNFKFEVTEIQSLNGISLNEIKNAISHEKLKKEYFEKISQQGFNILRIEKKDFERVLELDKELFSQRYNKCKVSFPDETDTDFIEKNTQIYRDFISLFPFKDHPEEIDKLTPETVFQTGNKKTLSYMIQYWAAGTGIKSGDYIESIISNIEKFKSLLKGVVDPNKSHSQKIDLQWSEIPQLGGDRLIAKKLVFIFNIESSLAISTSDMQEMLLNFDCDYEKESINRLEKLYTNLTLGEKYQLLTELLLKVKESIDRDWDNITFNHFLYKCVSSRYIKNDELEKIDDNKGIMTNQVKIYKNQWFSINSKDIEKIIKEVINYGENKLGIDEEVIKRIINHFICSKNVILIGAPGMGKTDLARRILRVLGKWVLGNEEPMESVATYEWGRYEVIGGNSLKEGIDGNYIFNFGCVTKAIKEEKLLLIDEFNRADMNKAFGEMFLAVDHGCIELHAGENPIGINFENNSHSIIIPSYFRIICTMNDYDKSLLNDLSYGLLRRFAFVEIEIPPKDKLILILKERVNQKFLDVIKNEDHIDINDLFESTSILKKFIDFIYSIYDYRRIGVATIIDVINYIVSGMIFFKREIKDQWKLLDEALIDYVIPQFDRLDLEVLRKVNENINSYFKVSEKVETILFQVKINEMSNKINKLSDLFETSK